MADLPEQLGYSWWKKVPAGSEEAQKDEAGYTNPNLHRRLTSDTGDTQYMVGIFGLNNKAETNIWESAVYTEDQTFGEGTKTVVVKVEAQEKSVTFTIKTDKETVGAALMEYGLIDGEEGPYGLYVKAVNGMKADYDTDQRYWAFYVNGEISMTGVDVTEIADGANYQMIYSR